MSNTSQSRDKDRSPRRPTWGTYDGSSVERPSVSTDPTRHGGADPDDPTEPSSQDNGTANKWFPGRSPSRRLLFSPTEEPNRDSTRMNSGHPRSPFRCGVRTPVCPDPRPTSVESPRYAQTEENRERRYAPFGTREGALSSSALPSFGAEAPLARIQGWTRPRTKKTDRFPR